MSDQPQSLICKCFHNVKCLERLVNSHSLAQPQKNSPMISLSPQTLLRDDKNYTIFRVIAVLILLWLLTRPYPCGPLHGEGLERLEGVLHLLAWHVIQTRLWLLTRPYPCGPLHGESLEGLEASCICWPGMLYKPCCGCWPGPIPVVPCMVRVWRDLRGSYICWPGMLYKPGCGC